MGLAEDTMARLGERHAAERLFVREITGQQVLLTRPSRFGESGLGGLELFGERSATETQFRELLLERFHRTFLFEECHAASLRRTACFAKSQSVGLGRFDSNCCGDDHICAYFFALVSATRRACLS